MKKLMLLIVLLAGMGLVQGCGTYYHNPDVTFEQFQQDSKDCKISGNYRNCMLSKGYQAAISPDLLLGRETFVKNQSKY